MGRFVPLKGYDPVTAAEVGDASLDVVANYIGIHHSPPAKRDAFVRSIHHIFRPGGRMILRDHNVNSVEMNHMVALAHDVFNVGLGTDWSVNQKEIRNFSSMTEIIGYLDRFGLKLSPRKSPILRDSCNRGQPR